jgi:site-specific recombinase XerD
MAANSGVRRRVPLTRLLSAVTLPGDAVKDRSYRSTPLGSLVARYYIWKQDEWGATENTLRDYEIPLAYLCQRHPTLPLSAFEPPDGRELVRVFLHDCWGQRAPRTRAKNLSILRDFFKWCQTNDLMKGDPTLGILRPKPRDPERNVYQTAEPPLILAACARLRDRCAVGMLIEWGMRKGELTGFRLKDYDADRQRIRIRGKGGKVRMLPVISAGLMADLDLHWRDRLETGDTEEFLLYPEKRGPRHSKNEADLGTPISLLWEDRHQPLSASAMHNWWKARLRDAGVPHARKMHEMRHTALTDLLRATHNLELVRKMAGHADISTTAQYLHFDVDDIAEGLILLAKKRAEEADRA